jgi:hypothetical protein
MSVGFWGLGSTFEDDEADGDAVVSGAGWPVRVG